MHGEIHVLNWKSGICMCLQQQSLDDISEATGHGEGVPSERKELFIGFI